MVPVVCVQAPGAPDHPVRDLPDPLRFAQGNYGGEEERDPRGYTKRGSVCVGSNCAKGLHAPEDKTDPNAWKRRREGGSRRIGGKIKIGSTGIVSGRIKSELYGAVGGFSSSRLLFFRLKESARHS